jgi:hypothetical protein
MSQSSGMEISTNNGGDNINVINVVDTVLSTATPDMTELSRKRNRAELFKQFVRNNQAVEIPVVYSAGTHNEYKSECQRLMRDFLTNMKIYEKIKSVLDSINTIVETLCEISIDGVSFVDELDTTQQNANVIANKPFQDSVYQLLEDTYGHLPDCNWTCPYRKSELIQNRGHVIEHLAQAKTNLNATATTLNEFLSKLIKIKQQKTVFDFVSERLDTL